MFFFLFWLCFKCWVLFRTIGFDYGAMAAQGGHGGHGHGAWDEPELKDVKPEPAGCCFWFKMFPPFKWFCQFMKWLFLSRMEYKVGVHWSLLRCTKSICVFSEVFVVFLYVFIWKPRSWGLENGQETLWGGELSEWVLHRLPLSSSLEDGAHVPPPNSKGPDAMAVPYPSNSTHFFYLFLFFSIYNQQIWSKEVNVCVNGVSRLEVRNPYLHPHVPVADHRNATREHRRRRSHYRARVLQRSALRGDGLHAKHREPLGWRKSRNFAT